MGALLLLVLLAAEPAAETTPPPEPMLRPDQTDFHVWIEPVTLVRNLVEADGTFHPLVLPIAFEYKIKNPWWFAAQLTLLYRDDRLIGTLLGGTLSIGPQFAIGHFGPISFFIEPKFVGGVLSQQPVRPVTAGMPCIMGCVIQTTALEAGVGAMAGAAVNWRGIYIALVIGAEATWYSGGDNSFVGFPFAVLKRFFLFNEHGDEVSPNLSVLRIGGSF